MEHRLCFLKEISYSNLTQNNESRWLTLCRKMGVIKTLIGEIHYETCFIR